MDEILCGLSVVHLALGINEDCGNLAAVYEVNCVLPVLTGVLNSFLSGCQLNACNAFLVLGVNADNNAVVVDFIGVAIAEGDVAFLRSRFSCSLPRTGERSGILEGTAGKGGYL